MLLVKAGMKEDLAEARARAADRKVAMRDNLLQTKSRARAAITGPKPLALSFFSGLVVGSVLARPGRPRIPTQSMIKLASRMGMAYLASKFW